MLSSDLSGYNTNDGDGCSSLCAIELNFILSGGSVSSSDSCSACPAGLSPDATKTSCVATCGDSKRTSSETCDDGDTTSGGGCSSNCAIEAGLICNGGTTSSPDVCNICSAGLYPITDSTICEPHCGDSKRAGSETCNDGNTNDGDGCSSSCTSVGTNWVCSGGSTTTSDTCTFCSSGWYQNDVSTPTTCVVTSYMRQVYTKNDKFIDFPLKDLDLSKYCDPDAKLDNCKYDLYRVIHHTGSVDAGHYYTTIKNDIDSDEWFMFNDEIITPCSESDVVHENAYTLFYRKSEK